MPSLYRPQFAPDEFRARSYHYRIEIGGKRLLYCYIRKNACSAFKRLIARRMPAKYWVRAALRGSFADRYEIEGGLNGFALPMQRVVDPAAYDHIVFVTRDPAERFVSAYLNKFVDVSGADRIGQKYEAATGAAFDDARMVDFMGWSRMGFDRLDPHLWPQKAHLWDLPYTAVPITGLQAGMARLIGPEAAAAFFAQKVNASDGQAAADYADLTDVPARDLRAMRAAGRAVTRANFLTPALRAHVAEIYAADVAMLAEIDAGAGA